MGKAIIDVFLTKDKYLMWVKVKIDMKYVGWGGISINWNTVDHIEKVHEAKTNAENNDGVYGLVLIKIL